jgi:hypothetical protein
MARQQRKQEVTLNDRIPVVNFTNGTLFYRSKKSGRVWDLVGFGAKDYMEMDELIAMRSSNPKLLTNPSLIILDDEAVNHLGLTELYKNIRMPDEIDKLFDMKFDEFVAVLSKSPVGMKQLIVNRAKVLIESGELDSRRIIKAIETECKVHLVDE